MIKNSKFTYDNKEYRMEIAIDIEEKNILEKCYIYAKNEHVINECLQYVFSTMNPEESLQKILEYIGMSFECDRAYIFEMDAVSATNTYEWCRQSAEPQKEILQQVPLSLMKWWIDLFKDKKVVIIQNLEDIRAEYPSVYALLKPQNIQTLTVGPLCAEEHIIGFIGVDNPDREKLYLISSLLNVIGYIIISLLKRRDLLKKLNVMSFHDSLTGLFNRNALFDRYGGSWSGRSLGVIFCDITGLKQVNDVMGHEAGDELIRQSCRLFREALRTTEIFRTGGDEFIAVFPDMAETEFMNRLQQLRKRILEGGHHIATGQAWSDRQPLSLEELISQADKVMYYDKRNYYAVNGRTAGIERRKTFLPENHAGLNSRFHQFMDSTCCDMEMFFNSISAQNTTSYFYFGDMQKNIFYISDNMRDEFGFSGNVVPNLLEDWEKRITTARDREMYKIEMESMFKEKRGVQDLRYRVRTADGRNIWVRCYSMLKWNEDKSIPLFFSGRVTHQDENFVIDPVSNFPREGIMFRTLDKARKSGLPLSAIGFSLNNFMEINSTRGRACGDRLIRSIATELVDRFSDRLTFYRLEGMRFIALSDALDGKDKKQLVDSMRSVIAERYGVFGVPIQHPCSFAVLEYTRENMLPEEFLEQTIALIKIAKHEVTLDYVEYSASNLEKSRQLSNMALALNHDVLHGMKNFRIVVQPLVSVATGKVVGGETLLRWSFNGRDIAPAAFIPLLEQNKMIHLVGRWVFEQTVSTCMRINSYQKGFYLSFNVSLQQMSDEKLPEVMEQILSRYRVDGALLIAEVTESCMDADADKLQRFVQICRKRGIRLALDDFGSGYSSFRMLLRYPTDIIKIDRSILQEMTESSEKMNFISSIVYACHRFGKQVCMEGVETAEQNRLIRESGCDLVQGYYHHRPLELEQMYELAARESEKDADEADAEEMSGEQAGHAEGTGENAGC